MALGEKIKACRQRAGMSQEKVAELVGVSRQAVTKWEVNQSAPNTENLFKLAEIFGTTVDMLLASEDENKPSPAEQIYYLYKMEEEKKAALKKQAQKRTLLIALLIAVGYMSIYLIGRIIWCDLSQSTLIGWLFFVRPSGEHSYLYGWLLSSNLFYYSDRLHCWPCSRNAFWPISGRSLYRTQPLRLGNLGCYLPCIHHDGHHRGEIQEV